ncbi:MAG: DivIVA domain-containing protein [Propionibacteriaceae bacterium]|nr:DivIVA domain-containing protein [Propionibacteriaceae bacterium]
MQLVIVLIAVAALGLGALIAAGRFGQQQTEPVRDTYEPATDDERLSSDDLEQARFALAPLGYDMAQVDEWIARAAREIDRRDDPGVTEPQSQSQPEPQPEPQPQREPVPAEPARPTSPAPVLAEAWEEPIDRPPAEPAEPTWDTTEPRPPSSPRRAAEGDDEEPDPLEWAPR